MRHKHSMATDRHSLHWILIIMWISPAGSSYILAHTMSNVYQDLSGQGINVTQRKYLLFGVQTCAEAYLGLFNPNPLMHTLVNDMYEIVLGASNNTLSLIRRGQIGTGHYLTHANGPMLDCKVYNYFWVRWAYGMIQIGTGRCIGINMIMELSDPSPRVNYFGVSSGNGYIADWAFETEISCPCDRKLVNSSGLLVAYNGFTENDNLIYYCKGNVTAGNLIRTCQYNSTWSGIEPKCERLCTNDTKSINSSGLLTQITGVSVNGSLIYKCNQTLLSGNLERICQDNGTWSGDEPLCCCCEFSKQLDEDVFKTMLHDMKVDEKSTSKYQRLKKSASDNRVISRTMGCLGAIIIAAVVVIIVISDIPLLIRQLDNCK